MHIGRTWKIFCYTSGNGILRYSLVITDFLFCNLNSTVNYLSFTQHKRDKTILNTKYIFQNGWRHKDTFWSCLNNHQIDSSSTKITCVWFPDFYNVHHAFLAFRNRNLLHIKDKNAMTYVSFNISPIVRQ